MKIDRNQFLLLTAAITATTTGGCGPSVTAELPPPKPASSTMRPAPVPAARSTTDQPYDPLGAPPPGAVAEGSMAPAPTAEGGYAIAEVGYPRQASYAPDPRCAALRAPGATCESFSSTVDLCNGVVQHLDKPLADAVVGCLSQKSNTQKICQWNVVSACLDQSAARVRPGARDTATCVSAASKCSQSQNFDRRRCVAALSHAAPPRRNRLASCISEFCEIGTCVYELSP